MCGSPSSLWLQSFVTASVASTAYRSHSGVSACTRITRMPEGVCSVWMGTASSTFTTGNEIHPGGSDVVMLVGAIITVSKKEPRESTRTNQLAVAACDDDDVWFASGVTYTSWQRPRTFFRSEVVVVVGVDEPALFRVTRISGSYFILRIARSRSISSVLDSLVSSSGCLWPLCRGFESRRRLCPVFSSLSRVFSSPPSPCFV